MARITRIKGGEKNIKSRQKWTRDELTKVLELFIENRQLKIHEANTDIHELAKKLGRTSRSVEAQLLMFRNLDKHGDYSFGNMNKLCKEIWKDYLQNLIK
jgi:hypothetical protein